MFNNFVAQNMEISPTVQGTVNCDSPDEKKIQIGWILSSNFTDLCFSLECGNELNHKMRISAQRK